MIQKRRNIQRELFSKPEQTFHKITCPPEATVRQSQWMRTSDRFVFGQPSRHLIQNVLFLFIFLNFFLGCNHVYKLYMGSLHEDRMITIDST